MICCRCKKQIQIHDIYPSAFKIGWHICKDCYKKKCKKYNKTHSEKIKARNHRYFIKNIDHIRKKTRIWMRENTLTTNGLHIKVKKRHFSGFCELCVRQIINNPHWHHWEDKHPEIGMWLCGKCHSKVEVIERYYSLNREEKERYLKLKETITKLIRP